MKFLMKNTIIPHVRNLGLWPDDAQYGLIIIMEHKDLGSFGFFTISNKFPINRPSCPYIEILRLWPDWGIVDESR
jgi:hypothetical protein